MMKAEVTISTELDLDITDPDDWMDVFWESLNRHGMDPGNTDILKVHLS